ncbi:MAG TPA: PAS domain S-box protein, partial [Chloroflexota bacterium]|nr:PAS domain S-box protein [Chloroflexota bacterium]
MDYFGDGQPARDSSLRDSANLTAVIDACPLAVMVLASDGTVRLWNPACARMFGWTADEAIGQFLPAIPRERQAEFRSNLEAVLRGNAFTGVETIRQRKGGGSVDVAIWAVPVVDADGQVGCLSMLADISERKRAERTQAFLGEVSDVLASSLDYSETINRICRLTVPILADYCQIYLVEGTGRLQRIAVAHADPARDALARSLVRRYPLSLTDEDPTSQAVRTGRSVIEPCLTDDQLNRMARDPDHRQILQSLDIGPGISVPIQARGKV